MRRIAIGALLLAAGVTATAQGPEFRVEVRLVEVETRVTDSAGQPVPGLRRGDFTLQENGVTHDIASVAYMASTERTLPVPGGCTQPGHVDVGDHPARGHLGLHPDGNRSRRCPARQ